MLLNRRLLPGLALAAVAVAWVPPSARAQAEAGEDAGLRAPEPGDVEVRGRRVVFTWEAVPGARSYRFQLARSLLFMPRAVELTTTRPRAEPPRLPPGQLYWRVAAVGADGTPGSFSAAQLVQPRAASREPPPPAVDVDVPVVSAAVVSAPVVAPSPGAAATTSPTATTETRARRGSRLRPRAQCPEKKGEATVTWNFGARGKRRMQVAEDRTFAHVVFDQVVTTPLVRARLGNGRYFYRWVKHAAWTPDPAWVAVEQLLVHCDEKPPALKVVSPPPLFFTTAPAITLQGTTDPGASVSVNDHVLDVDDAGNFTLHMELRPGLNELALVTSDASGNETHRVVTGRMFTEATVSRVRTRVVELQAHLNVLDTARAELERRVQEMTRHPDVRVNADALELLRSVEPELRAQRDAKRQLTSDASRFLLELQPGAGVRVPPAGARVEPFPAVRPPPPPPAPPPPPRARRRR